MRDETPTTLLNDEQRREKARQMILEAFKERPEPQQVIASKPVLHLIEHEPASDKAKSGEPSDRSG